MRGWLAQVWTVVPMAGMLAACAPAPRPYPELPLLTLSTRFAPNNLCSLGVSPAIQIAKAPGGVARYTIRMTNMEVLVQTPWEGIADGKDGDIQAGAARPYAAPCLGDRQRFVYRFEVLAVDRAGRPLAYGQTFATAVSLDRTIALERQIERNEAARRGSIDAPTPLPRLIDPRLPDNERETIEDPFRTDTDPRVRPEPARTY